MEHFVITIARQYGSGGRTVGEMLAKKLGISYYDKQIIHMASDESGIDVSLFGKVEEGNSVKKNSLFNRTGLYKGDLIPPDSKEFISDENLFNYQAKVIHDLAEKESFVVIGRCVNYVLKDRPNTLRVFVHAPWEFRVEQAMTKISGTREEVEKFLLKDDKRKQDYYRRFAGGVWNDATNYDLCLNCGKLGFDKCVEAIEAQMNIMRR
ncbi:MAG TPA: cytidylate kinase-like family protein [Candidatus Blautia faecavium]|uniref:Cytidylate kinase-like family protein n=1 Tax=Candidatus Blautia faecavium TaxID=2838487 RepID=A0A9D2RYU7_9FIRM|nr:cytidylate kinase-like family protein [Candidatus Blautia faecavium]